MTSDEAVELVFAYRDELSGVILSGTPDEVDRCEAARFAIIAALTAPPKVDVRKVCEHYADHNGTGLDWADMTKALRAAGVEVIE